MELDTFVKQYLVTALWSSNDESTPEGGEPMDANYSIDDISFETMQQAKADCKRFLELASDIIYKYDIETAGHDFWLTRNGHGAGFWDGDYGDDGDLLTEICKTFGECNPWVGDDGKIYIE